MFLLPDNSKKGVTKAPQVLSLPMELGSLVFKGLERGALEQETRVIRIISRNHFIITLSTNLNKKFIRKVFMVKIVRLLGLFIFSHLLLVESSFAEVSSFPVGNIEEESVKLESEFSQRADFINIMLQVGEEIDRKINLDKEIFDRPEKMTALLEEKILVYHSFYEKTLQIPNEKKGIFKKFFLSLNWKKIVPAFRKAHIGVEVFFKKKGLGLGIALMAGFLCEYLVPAILVNIGLPQLIPLSMMTPWSIMYSFIPEKIQKLKIRKMLTEALGGKSQVEAYMRQQETFLKLLHKQSPDEFIFPISESAGQIRSIVIQKETWLTGLLQRLGVKDSSLTYTSVQKFLMENNISDPYVTWIIENESIDRNTKVGLITSHILNLKDSTIEENFQKTFSEKILLLKNNENWEEAWNWTLEMKKVKSLDELVAKINEIPSSIHPKEFSMIWENMLLPDYAINLNLNYIEARQMFDQFEVLKAKLMTSESALLDESIKNEIFIYLKTITHGKKFKGCQNGLVRINQFLLEKVH